MQPYWEAWEQVRRDVQTRNAALLAISVEEQRTKLAAVRTALLGRARLREAEASITGRSDHRAQARQWAADHPDAGERLADLQAQVYATVDA